MKLKQIAAALLQIALVTTAMSQQPSSENQDKQLSVEEEREARALAADFLVRFEDSADIAAMLPLFTSDFSKRLRHAGGGAIAAPVAVIDGPVIGMASDEELVRCYSETINFIYLATRHYQAALWLRNQRGPSDATDAELTAAEVLPAEAVKLLKSDPLFRELFRFEETPSVSETQVETPSTNAAQNDLTQIENSNSENSAGKETLPGNREDRNTIKGLLELRSYISTLARANAVLRTSAKSLITMKALMEVSGDQSSVTDEDILNPRVFVLTKEWLNYRAGERLICVDVLLFHMDLVRVDGRLQVASLYLDSGCN